MKERDQLFYLIKSLSRQEKKEFLMESSRRRGKKDAAYLKLYHWYLKAKKPPATDKTALKKFKLNSNQFAVQKNYLFNRLLSSLQHYHALQPRIKVRNNISRTEILYAKGLLPLAHKLLKEAETNARLQQHWPLVMEGIHLRNTLLFHENAHTEIEKTLEQEIEQLKTRTTEAEYRLLEYRIISFGKKIEYVRTAAERKQLRQLLHHPALKNPEMAGTTDHKIVRHLSFLHAASLEQMPVEQLYRSEQILLLLIENASYTRVKLIEHLSALYLYTLTVIHYGSRSQLLRALKTGRHFLNAFGKDLKSEHKEHIRIMKAGLSMRYHTLHGNFSSLDKLFTSIQPLLKSPLPIAKTLTDPLSYYKACFCFGSGKLKMALKHLVDVDYEPDFTYRQYRTAMRGLLLQTAIHYELENTDVCERLCKLLEKFILRHERSKGTKHVVLNFLQKLLHSSGRTNPKKLFAQAYKEILNTCKEQNDWEFYTNNPLFTAWLLKNSLKTDMAYALRISTADFKKSVHAASSQRYKVKEKPLQLLL